MKRDSPSVSECRYVDVGLELDVDAEPIAGRVRHGEAASRAFAGWLELAAVLEDALSGGRQAAEGSAPARNQKDT